MLERYDEMAESAMPEFDIFDIQGVEYHRWVLDVRNTLIGKRLTDTIQPILAGQEVSNDTTARKDQALMFLIRHIHLTLRKQYLLKDDPADLWVTLQERFNNVHDAHLPELIERWDIIQLLDYPKINDFY